MDYKDIRTNAKGLEYGGEAHDFYYDSKYNHETSYKNTLADCTTYAEGDVQEKGSPCPIKQSGDANNWDALLTNGWEAIDYDESKLENGDIVQWKGSGIHVAVFQQFVNGVPYISGSFYTGSNGKAFDGKKFSERESIGKTPKEISDWCFKNYSYRTFHYCPISTENSWVGQKPSKILKNPTIYIPHAKRDNKKLQIEVFKFKHCVRVEPTINAPYTKDKCYSRLGIFDVLATKEADGYKWAKLGNKQWIAICDDIVLYDPNNKTQPVTPSEESLIKQLETTINNLKSKCLNVANENSNLKKDIANKEKLLSDINTLAKQIETLSK